MLIALAGIFAVAEAFGTIALSLYRWTTVDILLAVTIPLFLTAGVFALKRGVLRLLHRTPNAQGTA